MRLKWLLPCIALFLALADGSSAESPRKKIISLRSSRLFLYDQALEGFKKCLKQQNVQFDLEDYILPEKFLDAETMFEEIQSKKPDIVLTLGSVATRFAKDRIKKIPIVFCMAVDPGFNGLTSGGITLDVEPSVQIDYIRNNFPRLRRIGIIYNPARNKETIQKFRELTQKGDTEIVFVNVASPQEIGRAIDELKAKADCLLMVSDPVLYSPQTAAQFFLQTLRYGIPIIAISASFVKAGALAGVYANCEDNGCLASRMAVQVMADENVDPMAIQWPSRIDTSINMVVADRLRVLVNPSAVQNAEQVIK